MARTSTQTVHANNAAVLNKIRKARTVAAPVQPAQPVAADVSEPDEATLYERARASVQQLFDSIEMPSWTRQVVSTVIAVTMSAITAYGCMSLLDMLLYAVMAYTTSQFILFVIAFVGMIMTMIATVSAGTKMFEVCIEFDVRRIKSRVSGWFASKPLIDDAALAR